MIATPELIETMHVWPTVSKVVSVLHTQEQYERAVAFLDTLIDTIGGQEDHPLASLLDTIGSHIETYENSYIREPIGDPISSLKYLMAEHDLQIHDLSEIGNESMVYAVLNGKQALTIAQIKALGERFHVSPTVFL